MTFGNGYTVSFPIAKMHLRCWGWKCNAWDHLIQNSQSKILVSKELHFYYPWISIKFTEYKHIMHNFQFRKRKSESLCDFVTNVTNYFWAIGVRNWGIEVMRVLSKREFGQPQFFFLLCASYVGAKALILQDQGSFWSLKDFSYFFSFTELVLCWGRDNLGASLCWIVVMLLMALLLLFINS